MLRSLHELLNLTYGLRAKFGAEVSTFFVLFRTIRTYESKPSEQERLVCMEQGLNNLALFVHGRVYQV